jgi:poly(3-hydroxybutyrate) depolymerase
MGLALLLAASAVALAQTRPADEAPTPGDEVAGGEVVERSFISRIDRAQVVYALWVPKAYDPNRTWPLIVFLHGSGEGANFRMPLNPKAGVPVRGVRSDLDFFVAFPLMRGSRTISGLAEQDVLETIADALSAYPIDPDRVHLTGLSLGGFACWQIACHHPHLFASAVPFCGGGRPDLAVNLRHLPVQAFHGEADRHVSPSHTQAMIDAMRAARLDPTFHLLRGLGHVCWQQAYASPQLYDWMREKKRLSAPRRITFRTHALRFAQAYWAMIVDRPDAAQPAAIDVFAPPGAGQVLIHAENVGRLLLNPPAEILGDTAPHVFADGERVTPTHTNAGWLVEFPGAPVGPRTKHAGLSGPIQDFYHEPYFAVPPTQCDEQEQQAWQHVAQAAFGWTDALVYRNLPAVADTNVPAEVIAGATLICFGDASNNALLARISDALPLQWRDGRAYVEGERADGVGAFAMIYPNPLALHRYVVVCSGEPALAARAAAIAFTPSMLGPMPQEDLIALGRDGRLIFEPHAPRDPARPMNAPIPPRGPLFDSSWRLPDAARARLLEAAVATTPTTASQPAP